MEVEHQIAAQPFLRVYNSLPPERFKISCESPLDVPPLPVGFLRTLQARKRDAGEDEETLCCINRPYCRLHMTNCMRVTCCACGPTINRTSPQEGDLYSHNTSPGSFEIRGLSKYDL